MIKYKYHESFDLGETYKVTIEGNDLVPLSERGQEQDKKGDRRWVITENGKPKTFCTYIFSLLKCSLKHPKSMVVTEDPFATMLLEDIGIKVIKAQGFINRVKEAK